MVQINDNSDWRARLKAKHEARLASMPRVEPSPAKPKRVKQRPSFYGPPPAVGTIYQVRVVCEPKGQPRPKARIVKPLGRASFIQFYDPHDADAWKAAVKRAFSAAGAGGVAPIDNPVSVSIDFLLPRPKYLCTPWYQQNAAGELRARCKPDRDNAEKATLDALTDFGLWQDDAQVCEGPVRKRYHAIGDQPGARITVEVLPPNPEPPKRSRAVQAETLF